MTVKEELEKVINEYVRKFKRTIPGWRCSDEERLADLKKAIESNTPYPEDDETVVY